MARLLVKESFHAFGTDYPVGAEVDPSAATKWPGDALATRLQNGSVAYEVAENGEEIAGVDISADVVAVCKNGFSAWGNNYSPGDTIPIEHHEKWPAGTLGTRLNNGDIEFKPASEVIVPTDSAETSAPATVVVDDEEDPNDVDLETLKSEELVVFAKTHFGEDLDPDLPHDELLELAKHLVEASQS